MVLTRGLDDRARRSLATRAAIIAGSILVGSAPVGNWLLSALGISIHAFRIAGGLLLFSIAFEMVFDLRTPRQTRQAEQAVEEHVRDLAAFPLAIPLMAGQSNHDPVMLALLIGVILVVMAPTLAAFIIAAKVARLLGNTGNIVLSRLLGVLLAALSVQFIIDDVRAAPEL